MTYYYLGMRTPVGHPLLLPGYLLDRLQPYYAVFTAEAAPGEQWPLRPDHGLLADNINRGPQLPWDQTAARQFTFDCVERLVPLYEYQWPGDKQVRNALANGRRDPALSQPRALMAEMTAGYNEAVGNTDNAHMSCVYFGSEQICRTAEHVLATFTHMEPIREARDAAAYMAAERWYYETYGHDGWVDGDMVDPTGWDTAYAAAYAAEHEWQVARMLTYLHPET